MNRFSNILKEVDAVIFLSEISNFYITDFKSSFGVSVVTDKNIYFLTDSRYKLDAEKSLNSGIELRIISSYESQYGLVEDILKNEKCKTIAIDESVSFFEYKSYEKALAGKFEIKSVQDKIRLLRTVKTETEIEKITRAQRIAEASFEALLPIIKVGVTEKELALKLEYMMREKGAESVSFDTIVAFGDNSAKPHSHISDRKLATKDILLFDFGCKVDGYCSDMTRTICIGEATEEFRNVYDTVLGANLKAIGAIKTGVEADFVDKVARDYIADGGYVGAFIHSLGHGVGLEIHEEPRLSGQNKAQLEKNMVVTVEPGIYLDNKFGVRIEDMVVVKDDGALNLTLMNKKIIIL